MSIDLRQYDSYDETMRAFEWDIPADYNVA